MKSASDQDNHRFSYTLEVTCYGALQTVTFSSMHSCFTSCVQATYNFFTMQALWKLQSALSIYETTSVKLATWVPMYPMYGCRGGAESTNYKHLQAAQERLEEGIVHARPQPPSTGCRPSVVQPVEEVVPPGI